MDGQQFNTEWKYYSPPGSELLLTSAERGCRGFAAFCIRFHPTEDFAPEPPDATHTDRVALHVSGAAQLEHKFDEQRHRGKSTPGSIYILPKGRPSSWHWNQSATFLYLCFFPSTLARIAVELHSNVSDLELSYLFNGHDPLIQHAGWAILTELQTGGLLGGLYAESLAQTLAIHLIRNYSNIPSHPTPSQGLTARQLRRVQAYIHEWLCENLSLSDLASVAGLSGSYFSRQFKQSTGLSPHQYLIQCRLERAKSLLLHDGRLTIAEIAHQVGFADQSHLNHHFKRAFGVLPRGVLQNGKNVQKEGEIVQDGGG